MSSSENIIHSQFEYLLAVYTVHTHSILVGVILVADDIISMAK